MIVKEFKKKGPVYKVQTFGTLQSKRGNEKVNCRLSKRGNEGRG